MFQLFESFQVVRATDIYILWGGGPLNKYLIEQLREKELLRETNAIVSEFLSFLMELKRF